MFALLFVMSLQAHGMLAASTLPEYKNVNEERFVHIRNFIDDYYPHSIQTISTLSGKATIIISDTPSSDDYTGAFPGDLRINSEQIPDDVYRRWTSAAPVVNKTLLLPVTETTVIYDATADGRNSTLVTTRTIANVTKAVQVSTSNGTKELVIAWFSPKRPKGYGAANDGYSSDTYSFWRNAGALTLGVKRVRDENLLPNYNITLIHAHGGCDPINTIRKASELLETASVDVFIGPSCSGAAVPLNYFVEANRIPHILHGVGDPELSNRQLHPHAVRPVQNFYDSGVCLRDYFVSVMNWNQLAVVYQADYYQCDFFLQGILQKEPAALLAQRAGAGESQAANNGAGVSGSTITVSNTTKSTGSSRSSVNSSIPLPATEKHHRLSIVGIHEASRAMSDSDIDQILTLIRDSTRVIATCFSVQTPDVLIRFMMRAKARNMMLSDGYVWLSFTTAIEDPSVPPYLHRNIAGMPREPLETALKQMNLSSTMRPADVISAFGSLIEISWQVDLSMSFRLSVMNQLTTHPMWNWTRAQLDKEEPEPHTNVGGLFSPHLADSVYLFARAIQEADRADPVAVLFNSTNSLNLVAKQRRNSTQMYEIMKSIDFWGESGYFALDDKGERLPSFTLRALKVNVSDAGDGVTQRIKIEFEKKGVISCNRPSTAAEVLRAEKSEAVPTTTKILVININETIPVNISSVDNKTTIPSNETITTTTTIVRDNKRNKLLIANYSATPGVAPVDWKTDNGLPPPATPVCGFFNELCGISLITPSSQTTSVLLIALLVVGFFSFVCLAAAFTIWLRNVKRNRVMMSNIWRLEPSAADLAALCKEGFGTGVFAREQRQPEEQPQPPRSNRSDGRGRNRLSTLSEQNENRRRVVEAVQKSRSGSSSSSDEDGNDEQNNQTEQPDDDETSSATVGTELNDPIRSNSVQTSKLGVLLSSYANSPDGEVAGQLVDVYAVCLLSFSGRVQYECSSNSSNSFKRDTAGSNVISSAALSHAAIDQLRAMKIMQHENINPFVGACFECDVPFFALLNCAKGTLADVLVNTQVDIDSLFKMSFLNDILNGLAFLHHAPTLRVYGRLRDENVVIDSRWTAKLTCYGFLECQGSVATTGRSSSTKGVIVAFDHPRHWLDSERYDKLLWTAPEILRAYGDLTEFDIKQLQAADVYSFAIIMSEVLYKQRPYQHMHERAKMLIEKLTNPQFELYYSPLRPLHTPFPVWQSTTPHQQRPSLAANAAQNPSLASSAASVASDRETLRAFENLRKLMVRAWHETPHERPIVNELMQNFKLVAAFRGASFMDLLVKKMESYASNLELLVRSRTAELVEETKRADMLLREILPESVVQQLKAGKSVEPEFFNSTTIFFSDIVQFTRIAGKLNPLQVVSLLNNFCVFMDDIIARYRVYKVETIGDGYLVVSGLPSRCRDHAAQIARMALRMSSCIGAVELPAQTSTTSGDIGIGSVPSSMMLLREQSADEVKSPTPTKTSTLPANCIRLRIGINTGPCVAGVVGLKMPRYCLFGDAVNVASRMESHGEPMKIHISEATKLELERRSADEFHIEERGEVFIKGKGNMLTYWLSAS